MASAPSRSRLGKGFGIGSSLSAILNAEYETKLRIDSGASIFETNDVYFNITRRDLEGLRLLDPGIAPVSYLSGTGAGGQVRLPVVRLKQMQLGETRVDNPFAIVQPDQGYFARPDAVGFVSNNLLEEFGHVVIDYPRRRLGLRCACSDATSGTGKPNADSAVEGPARPALRDELIRMMETDTQARAGMCESAMDPKDAERRREVDQRNTTRLKEIIAQHGWPNYRMVGKEGAIAAWLVVQHADHDVTFQQQCLKMLKTAYEQGEAHPKCVACLIDRVRVNTGQPQVYGTQFLLIDGKNQPRQIEDPAHVDDRRKQMGLSTLAEYARTMQGG